MTKLLQRVMNIESEEVAPILMAALYFFFILTALMILRPAREALGKLPAVDCSDAEQVDVKLKAYLGHKLKDA